MSAFNWADSSSDDGCYEFELQVDHEKRYLPAPSNKFSSHNGSIPHDNLKSAGEKEEGGCEGAFCALNNLHYRRNTKNRKRRNKKNAKYSENGFGWKEIAKSSARFGAKSHESLDGNSWMKQRRARQQSAKQEKRLKEETMEKEKRERRKQQLSVLKIAVESMKVSKPELTIETEFTADPKPLIKQFGKSDLGTKLELKNVPELTNSTQSDLITSSVMMTEPDLIILPELTRTPELTMTSEPVILADLLAESVPLTTQNMHITSTLKNAASLFEKNILSLHAKDLHQSSEGSSIIDRDSESLSSHIARLSLNKVDGGGSFNDSIIEDSFDQKVNVSSQVIFDQLAAENNNIQINQSISHEQKNIINDDYLEPLDNGKMHVEKYSSTVQGNKNGSASDCSGFSEEIRQGRESNNYKIKEYCYKIDRKEVNDIRDQTERSVLDELRYKPLNEMSKSIQSHEKCGICGKNTQNIMDNSSELTTPVRSKRIGTEHNDVQGDEQSLIVRAVLHKHPQLGNTMTPREIFDNNLGKGDTSVISTFARNKSRSHGGRRGQSGRGGRGRGRNGRGGRGRWWNGRGGRGRGRNGRGGRGRGRINHHYTIDQQQQSNIDCNNNSRDGIQDRKKGGRRRKPQHQNLHSYTIGDDSLENTDKNSLDRKVGNNAGMSRISANGGNDKSRNWRRRKCEKNISFVDVDIKKKEKDIEEDIRKISESKKNLK